MCCTSLFFFFFQCMKSFREFFNVFHLFLSRRNCWSRTWYEYSGHFHSFGIRVAEEDNTFGFLIELVDGKSSTSCTNFAEDFTLSLTFTFWVFVLLDKGGTIYFIGIGFLSSISPEVIFSYIFMNGFAIVLSSNGSLLPNGIKNLVFLYHFVLIAQVKRALMPHSIPIAVITIHCFVSDLVQMSTSCSSIKKPSSVKS